jgi:hypothetical protein
MKQRILNVHIIIHNEALNVYMSNPYYSKLFQTHNQSNVFHKLIVAILSVKIIEAITTVKIFRVFIIITSSF